jgi:uncharacterized membrane protein
MKPVQKFTIGFSCATISGIAAYILYLQYKVARENAAREKAQKEIEQMKANKWEMRILMLKIGASLCGFAFVYAGYRRITSAITSRSSH